jgi:hypothetical protein
LRWRALDYRRTRRGRHPGTLNNFTLNFFGCIIPRFKKLNTDPRGGTDIGDAVFVATVRPGPPAACKVPPDSGELVALAHDSLAMIFQLIRRTPNPQILRDRLPSGRIDADFRGPCTGMRFQAANNIVQPAVLLAGKMLYAKWAVGGQSIIAETAAEIYQATLSAQPFAGFCREFFRIRGLGKYIATD